MSVGISARASTPYSFYTSTFSKIVSIYKKGHRTTVPTVVDIEVVIHIPLRVSQVAKEQLREWLTTGLVVVGADAALSFLTNKVVVTEGVPGGRALDTFAVSPNDELPTVAPTTIPVSRPKDTAEGTPWL